MICFVLCCCVLLICLMMMRFMFCNFWILILVGVVTLFVVRLLSC